jgi:streptogramin lyase
MGPLIRDLEVAPDGSAWANAAGYRGLARFDGQTWTPYLAGRYISDFDIAPDGSVWAVAQEPGFSSGNTYVIRPEAVATID